MKRIHMNFPHILRSFLMSSVIFSCSIPGALGMKRTGEFVQLSPDPTLTKKASSQKNQDDAVMKDEDRNLLVQRARPTNPYSDMNTVIEALMTSVDRAQKRDALMTAEQREAKEAGSGFFSFLPNEVFLYLVDYLDKPSVGRLAQTNSVLNQRLNLPYFLQNKWTRFPRSFENDMDRFLVRYPKGDFLWPDRVNLLLRGAVARDEFGQIVEMRNAGIIKTHSKNWTEDQFRVLWNIADGDASMEYALRSIHSERQTPTENLSPETIGPFMDGLLKSPWITYLEIKNSKIGSRGAQTLAEKLSENPYLEQLLFQNAGIGPEDYQYIFKSLQKKSKIYNLVIQETMLDLDSSVTLGKLIQESSTLEQIALIAVSLEDDKFDPIADGIARNQKIKELIFYDNNLTSRNAQRLAEALEKNNSFERIEVSSNSIDDEGVQNILAALAGKENLRSLKLIWVELSYHSLDAIVDFIQRTPWLIELVLSDNYFSHADIDHLFEVASGYPNLTLQIDDNNEVKDDDEESENGSDGE